MTTMAGSCVHGTAVRPQAHRPIPLVAILTSLQFSVALLSLLLAATVLGTLVAQQADTAEYVERHGAALASLLLALGLDDLFHTAWFTGLLALLAASLVLTAVRRQAWRPPLWGHLLSHLGVVAVLAGGWIGRHDGFKGFIGLHEGESAGDARRLGRRGALGKASPLGFSVLLEDVEVEYYKAEPRFRVYERNGDKVRAVGAFSPEEAGRWRPLGASGAVFRVARTYPDDAGIAAPAEASPDVHAVSVRGAPGASTEEAVVRLGEASRLPEAGLEIEALEYLPDFVYDTETLQASSRSPDPNNPALRVRIRDLRTGGEQERWLFAKAPGFGHGEGPDVPGFFYRHLGGRGNPAADILLREAAGTRALRLEAGEPLRLSDGKAFLAFEAEAAEPKAFRSSLAVLEGGRKVAGKTIAVNDPLSYRGYLFYQSSFREEDPAYSGIQVVRDPGLGVVFAGFAMIFLGVAFVYYVRPVLLERPGDAV